RHDLARSIGQTRDLNHDMDGGCNLLAYGALGNVQVGHGKHAFKASERIARGVRVHRCEGALVASIHGLQHVEGLFAADLADDDAIRPHAQAVDDKLPLTHCTAALNIWGACLQPYYVLLLELQL